MARICIMTKLNKSIVVFVLPHSLDFIHRFEIRTFCTGIYFALIFVKEKGGNKASDKSSREHSK